MSAIARIPIRWRLTLAFALVMAVVLVATGAFLYLRLGDGAGRDDRPRPAQPRGRRCGAGPAGAIPDSAEMRLSRLAERGESFAQVLSSDGAIVDARRSSGTRRCSARRGLARANGPLWSTRPSRVRDEPARLLAAPVDAQGARLVIVVGASLDDRDEALESLLTLLLIGGPVRPAALARWRRTARRGGAAPGRVDAARGRARSPPPSRAGGCRCRPPRTRSDASARR